LNVIFPNELPAKLELIRRGNIVDIEDFGFGPDVSFRFPVTVDTPVHIQSVDAVRQRHLIHLAVTGGASYAFIDVNAVVEEDEIGQIVDAHPFDGPPGRPAIANRLRG
jgi:hypothetical protein